MQGRDSLQLFQVQWTLKMGGIDGYIFLVEYVWSLLDQFYLLLISFPDVEIIYFNPLHSSKAVICLVWKRLPVEDRVCIGELGVFICAFLWIFFLKIDPLHLFVFKAQLCRLQFNLQFRKSSIVSGWPVELCEWGGLNTLNQRIFLQESVEGQSKWGS